jgi:hypothetical protein
MRRAVFVAYLLGLACDGACAADAGAWPRAVARVNALRCLHGSLPVAMDAAMATDAQAWADTLGAEAALRHDPATQQGENLAMLSAAASSVSPEIALNQSIDMWYAEVRNYDFAAAGPLPGRSQADVGHFTQLVWAATDRVAFGVAIVPAAAAGGRVVAYVVARFYPPGNYPDELAGNVAAPTLETACRSSPWPPSPPPPPAATPAATPAPTTPPVTMPPPATPSATAPPPATPSATAPPPATPSATPPTPALPALPPQLPRPSSGPVGPRVSLLLVLSLPMVLLLYTDGVFPAVEL